MSGPRGKRKSPGTFPFDSDQQADASSNYNDSSHSSKKRKEEADRIESASSTSPRAKKSARSRTTMASGLELYPEADGDFFFTRGPGKAKKASTSVKPAASSGKATTPANDSSKGIAAANAVSSDAAPKTARPRKTASSFVPSPAGNSVRRSPRLQAGSQTPGGDHSHSSTTIKVSLAALEDTPVVRKRNKEMREAASGKRRSSIGLRGRRASSLTNGCVATPHPEVDHRDFFKHLSVDNSELIRMQHLLAWCGRRALVDEKPRNSAATANVQGAARVVIDDILQYITEQKIQINWWSRENNKEKAPPAAKKPNPKNVENLAKIERCSEQLQKLLDEKAEWEETLRLLKATGPEADQKLENSVCGVKRLTPAQAPLSSSDDSRAVASSLREVLGKTQKSLEFNIDLIQHGLHKVEQLGQASGRIGKKFLAETSLLLDQQQENTLKQAGTLNLPMQEVLIALSQMER